MERRHSRSSEGFADACIAIYEILNILVVTVLKTFDLVFCALSYGKVV